MDKEEVLRAIKRAELKRSLEARDKSTIEERLTRYIELNFITITPNEHFASISVECIELYRDGYFFACIALCQAVAEALVRLLCVKNNCRPTKVFEKNVETIARRKIEPNCCELLKEIWKDRDDYHHLRPKVPTEKAKLQSIAKSKLIALHKVESEVFAFEIVNGTIKPKYPKYWSGTQDGLLNVFLRFEV